MHIVEFNAVYIHSADVLDIDPLALRNNLRKFLDGCYLAVDADGHLLPNELPDLLNHPKYTKICSFFDRDGGIFDWHYTMYAPEDSDGPVNMIASIVSGGKTVRGPAVVVKDCAATFWDKLQREVDVEKVMTTLWFYHKNGRSAQEEFGERTLIRILAAQA